MPILTFSAPLEGSAVVLLSRRVPPVEIGAARVAVGPAEDGKAAGLPQRRTAAGKVAPIVPPVTVKPVPVRMPPPPMLPLLIETAPTL